MKASDFAPKRLQQILERPAVARFFARWSIGVGMLSALFVLTMAVSYFVFGISVRDGETGLPATPATVAVILLALAIGAALCIYSGIRRLRRSRDLD